ncbi:MULTISPECIES: HNH endonuclease signature motif containing protein [Pseudomonas syringae group]|uniref:HNH endonuclease n=1 Tax=Pseudomonas syringae group TaxID=136849 RepID=UPI000466937D|nr:MULTISPECIES: HNH endonuclease signature motif containing protein [Pseudomonas syringae group]
MANVLTTDHIENAYRIAGQVMDKGLSVKQGVAQLVTEGVGATYAQDLINVYRYMRSGRCYHRTINVEATNYFLRQLFEDGGAAYLSLALNATLQHIDYYERLQKLTLHRKRKVVAELESLLNGPVISHFAEFEVQVATALKDSSEARTARLACREHLRPKQVVITSTIFVRDPDVVAETLHRAAGFCEACVQPAPFTRRSDGTPYLEVHHKIRLADGGLDTLDNAIALCPNCHRASHYE